MTSPSPAPAGAGPAGGTGGAAGQSFLNRKVGPAPVWVWGVVGGVLVGVLYYLRRARQTTTTAASTQPSDQSTTGGQYPQYGPPSTTIVPQNAGLAQDQYIGILAAIKDQQNGTTTGSTGTQPATPPTLTAPILAPPGQEGPSGQQGSITLNWTPVLGADHYVVGWRAFSAGNANATSWDRTYETGPTTSWKSAGFNAGQGYYFGVQAVDAQGNKGPFSNQTSIIKS